MCALCSTQKNRQKSLGKRCIDLCVFCVSFIKTHKEKRIDQKGKKLFFIIIIIFYIICLKGIVSHFRRYAYLLFCQKLDEINTTAIA